MGATSAQKQVQQTFRTNGAPAAVVGVSGCKSDPNRRTCIDLLSKKVPHPFLSPKNSRRSIEDPLRIAIDEDSYRKLRSLKGDVRIQSIAFDLTPLPDFSRADDPIAELVKYCKSRSASIVRHLSDLDIRHVRLDALAAIPLSVPPTKLEELSAFLENAGWVLRPSLNEPLHVRGLHSSHQDHGHTPLKVPSADVKIPSPSSVSGPGLYGTIARKATEECAKSGVLNVGVVDTGVDLRGLSGHCTVEFLEADANGAIRIAPPHDVTSSHGTIVCSIIEQTMLHLAPRVRPNLIVGSAFYAPKNPRLATCSDASVGSAFSHVLLRAPPVINCSFVITDERGMPTYRDLLESMCLSATSSGIFVVGATGNEGAGFVGAPGVHETVLAVGAVNDPGHLWGGTGCELSPPARKPEILARGELSRASPQICTSWATANAAAHVAAAVAMNQDVWNSLCNQAEIVEFPTPPRLVPRLRHKLK